MPREESAGAGKKFGTRLEALRVLSGRTVKEISGDLGISPQSWYGYESGRTVPVATMLPHIARALRMPVSRVSDWLITEDDYVTTMEPRGKVSRPFSSEESARTSVDRLLVGASA